MLFKWNASIYQAMNHQDIQFIRVDGSTSRGYYSNVGRTQRQGMDLGLSGQHDRFRWSSSYSYIRATYDSDFNLLSGSNSSAIDNVIEVKKGNRMPSIPEHQFKLRAQFDVTPKWSIGTNVIYFSDQYVFGNENNKHQENSAACLNAGSLSNNDAACLSSLSFLSFSNFKRFSSRPFCLSSFIDSELIFYFVMYFLRLSTGYL
jgi:outer membrane receptor protein involved in Fe transport